MRLTLTFFYRLIYLVCLLLFSVRTWATPSHRSWQEKVPVFTLEQMAYVVDEDFTEPASVVAQLEAPSQVVTYEIVPDAVDFATLTADNTNGIYVFSPLPDRNGEENFTIKATNEQNSFFERVFTFIVNPVNDPPSFAGVAANDQRILVGSSPISVAAFATNAVPGPVTAVDEISQAVDFRLTVSDPALFAQPPLISSQGILTYQPVDDRIGTAQVSVVLEDDGEGTGSNNNVSPAQVFAIEVFAPAAEQDFGIDDTEIEENQPAGTVVGNFTRDDRYVLNGGANENLFSISGRALTINQPLNFEDPTQQTLEVRVERRYGFLNLSRESETFTITVTNVEEPPTSLTLTGATVAEGSPVGTSAGTLAAVGGAPEVPVTFALAPGGQDNGLFTIVGDQLLINQIPDFEAQSQYNVLVQAMGDGASAPQSFTVQVINTTEPPTSISLSNTTVAENQPLTTSVGVFSVEGGAGTEVAYTLKGADAAAFAVVGSTLVTNAALDFETKASYLITVTATGDGEFSQDFTIEVANAEEPPTALVLNNSAVAEGAPVGTAVGTLSASGGEPATVFELVPGAGADDNGSFIIEEGVLKTGAVFDFETKNSYTIRVRATGDGFYEEALAITIIDQPDPPNVIQLTSTSVREIQPTGTVVGELSASGGKGPYSFVLAGNQANNASFAIEGNELRTAQPLNFEATPTLEIVVRASNADGSFDQPFTITVVNEEEPPTAIALSSSSIRGKRARGDGGRHPECYWRGRHYCL